MLASEKCEACRADSPRVTAAEAQQLLRELSEWRIIEQDAVQRLQRVFQFKDFVSALAFTNEVGRIAEDAQHHPLIITEWGRVTVQWWTHAIRGLHRNDFILAARTALSLHGDVDCGKSGVLGGRPEYSFLTGYMAAKGITPHQAPQSDAFCN